MFALTSQHYEQLRFWEPDILIQITLSHFQVAGIAAEEKHEKEYETQILWIGIQNLTSSTLRKDLYCNYFLPKSEKRQRENFRKILPADAKSNNIPWEGWGMTILIDVIY